MRAEKEQHFLRVAADALFNMLQLFVHSKVQIEAERNSVSIMEYVGKQFELLPGMTAGQLERERNEKKITISKTKESAWGWFNRTVVTFILDRGESVCLYAFIKAGINVSGRRGPAIESYNANQKHYLGEDANSTFSTLIYKVMIVQVFPLQIVHQLLQNRLFLKFRYLY